MSLRAARWLLVAGTAVLLAITATGCGGSEKAQSKPTHQAKQPSASPSPAPKSRLKVTMPTAGLSKTQRPPAEAVLAYWTRYGTAVSTGDVKDSGLAATVSTASGVASTQRAVDTLNKKKQYYRGSVLLTIRAADVGPETATVDACVDQRKSLLTDATGKTVTEPDKVGVIAIAHNLVLHDKHWLVDRITPGGFSC